MRLLNKIVNLKNWEIEFQQRNSHPIIMADLWCRSCFNNFKQEINLLVGRTDYLFTATSKGYIKKIQKKKILKALKKACNNERYLNYIYQTTLKRIKELEIITRKINKEVVKEKISSEKLVDLWQEFDLLFLSVIPWFFIPWYVTEENIITDKVKKKLLKHKGKIESITDFNNALLLLINPIKKALFQKEQKDFFKLVDFARNKNDFETNKYFLKQASEYLKHYAWMKTFLFLPIEPLGLNELIKRIKEAIKEKTYQEYQLQELQRTKNRRLVNRLIRLLENDKQLLNYINWARNFGWLLTISVERSLRSMCDLHSFFKLIARRLNIDYDSWVLLTSQEIINGLKGIKGISKKDIEKRKQGYVFLMENGKPTLVVGIQAQNLSMVIDKQVNGLNKKIKIITGQPACPGIVKGKVKIVRMANECGKIKRGDVLVCSMTSPDYVLAMKRANAIVTDEGGLLSHAAIVSREIGKPCVVGTKIATKALKDGDLVEIDADKGIIKKRN